MSKGNDGVPSGWIQAPLADVVDVLDRYRIPVSAKERSQRAGNVPYFGASGQVGWIDEAIFDEDLTLLGEDGVQFFDQTKKKAYLISGKSWVNNHAHVLRARSEILDWRYLCHYLNVFNYEGYANGTTRLKLTKAAMLGIPVLLPPLGEQVRIVEALEEQLSRLDSAEMALKRNSARVKRLIPRVMTQILADAGGEELRLDQLAEVRLGRQRSPKNHQGENMVPYLRAANVGWQGLLLDDVKEMNFSGKETERYRLRDGDIVLSEASGSPGEVGKPAIWRGEIENCCFQNTLIRVRPTGIDPEFLLLYLRCLALRGDFRAGARGVGIHHLGAAKLASWPVPVPSQEKQKEAVEKIQSFLDLIDATSSAFSSKGAVAKRATALRTALLRKAFNGTLVPQDPADEPASELLARIKSGQEAATASKNPRTGGTRTGGTRKPAKTAQAAHDRLPAPAPTAAPTIAVQQEFEL
ncbi:restriction endonuclease subunit S [Streptomyces sp. NPDC050848]|uniref:restriction endonuclease subunit S n=1 Tax=Streptomyces sp. NPDC050848 TaxID=3155791 RepID=UPI00340A3892